MNERSERKDRRAEKAFRARCRRITLLFLVLTVLLFCLLSCGKQGDLFSGTVPPETDGPGSTTEPSLPEGWIWRDMAAEDLAKGDLVLVNAAHSFDPSLPETETVYEHKNGCYLVKDVYLSLTPTAMDALNRWMGAFAAETGVTDVNIVAGYRTREDQEALYENALENKGRDYAEGYFALPGCSEHHTGLALDLDTYDLETGTSGGFDGSGPYAWAVDHAWEYGFVQRYPPDKSGITGIRYESWHFRYVGRPHAWLMRQQSLCLEEYIDYLRGFPFDQGPLTVIVEGDSWRIYYAQGPRVPVPADGNYEISGNNVDGFIVTIRN